MNLLFQIAQTSELLNTILDPCNLSGSGEFEGIGTSQNPDLVLAGAPLYCSQKPSPFLTGYTKIDTCATLDPAVYSMITALLSRTSLQER